MVLPCSPTGGADVTPASVTRWESQQNAPGGRSRSGAGSPAEAYAAVTYADLDRLFTDLPTRPSPPVPAYSVASAAGVARAAGASVVRSPARFPLALKILWTAWASVVAINVTVWLLVSLAASESVHFWPMWFAVPGVALGIGTAITMRVRNSR